MPVDAPRAGSRGLRLIRRGSGVEAGQRGARRVGPGRAGARGRATTASSSPAARGSRAFVTRDAELLLDPDLQLLQRILDAARGRGSSTSATSAGGSPGGARGGGLRPRDRRELLTVHDALRGDRAPGRREDSTARPPGLRGPRSPRIAEPRTSRDLVVHHRRCAGAAHDGRGRRPCRCSTGRHFEALRAGGSRRSRREVELCLLLLLRTQGRHRPGLL